MLEPPPAKKPRSYPGKVMGTSVKYFEKRDPRLLEYRTMYEQGGPVSEGIDCHPLMMFTAGYRIEGTRQKEAEALMDDLDFETVGWKTAVDALVMGVGLAEKMEGVDATKYPIAQLDHRYPETFKEIRDDYGRFDRL